MNIGKLIAMLSKVNIKFMGMEIFYNEKDKNLAYAVEVETHAVHRINIRADILFVNNVDMTKHIFSVVYKKIREINIEECI